MCAILFVIGILIFIMVTMGLALFIYLWESLIMWLIGAVFVISFTKCIVLALVIILCWFIFRVLLG